LRVSQRNVSGVEAEQIKCFFEFEGKYGAEKK
jgi:hypothetical protein